MTQDPRLAIGLMSGTSLDGIDAALIESDGVGLVRPLGFTSRAYDPDFRARLRAVLGGQGPVAAVERELTLRHARIVETLIAESGYTVEAITVIGFHGHTILHEPAAGRTWQIGDGALLARETGIDVVSDLRANDVAHGGEGAPLVPLFQAALASDWEKPVAVLNVGGVANVTWIGDPDEPLIAFDTGPGNALINDWCERKAGRAFDEGGGLGLSGRVRESLLQELLSNSYFDRAAPKSLDRDHFRTDLPADLSLADGAATLAAFTAGAVARALEQVPRPPRRWLISGGGRHNAALMKEFGQRLPGLVAPIEAVGWNGDALEAQAFAYLALRSLDGQVLTYPTTTGVKEAVTGGQFHAKPSPFETRG